MRSVCAIALAEAASRLAAARVKAHPYFRSLYNREMNAHLSVYFPTLPTDLLRGALAFQISCFAALSLPGPLLQSMAIGLPSSCP